ERWEPVIGCAEHIARNETRPISVHFSQSYSVRRVANVAALRLNDSENPKDGRLHRPRAETSAGVERISGQASLPPVALTTKWGRIWKRISSSNVSWRWPRSSP